MKRSIGTVLLTAGVLAMAVRVGWGATFTGSMSVGATYDLAGNTLSSTSFISDGTPHIYRVDFFSSVIGLAANESFGAEAFNLALNGSSLSRNTVSAPGADLQTPKPNYVANNPVLSNVAAAGTFAPIPNFFAGGQNMDAGVSTTDLMGILVSVDQTNAGNVVDGTTHNPVTDPRQSIGVGSPFQTGSVYLRWNGNAAASLVMQNLQFSTVNSQAHQFGTVTNYSDVAFNFNPVPEPSTLELAGLGAFGMVSVARRRRCR